MKVTQLIPGVFGDTLLDVTPPRRDELKTSEDFQRELESGRYSREEILRDFKIDDATREEWSNRFAFPKAVGIAQTGLLSRRRDYFWSRAKVLAWRHEIQELATRLPK